MSTSTLRVYAVAGVVAATIATIITSYADRFTIEPAPSTVESASTYLRVLKTGTLRCGYIPYPPGLVKDPNSGEISGIFAETLYHVSADLGLTVEWTEQITWATMIEGLEAGRYDAVCSPVWENASRAKFADFTVPLFYSGLGAYVSARRDYPSQPLASINSPNVRIAVIAGEMSDIVARQDFPEAARVALPNLAPVSQLLLEVTEGKADVTIVEPYVAQQFLRNHPDSVVNIANSRPLRVFPNTIMLRKGDDEFRLMLNGAIQEAINSGVVDGLLSKYSGGLSLFYPVAYPYRAP